MCIICLEFNKSRDFVDAKGMIEAARRESNAISEEHLRSVEKKLKRMQDGVVDADASLDPLATT